MKTALLLILLLALTGCGGAAVADSGPGEFPASFIGKWKGEIRITPYEGEEQRLPMEMYIAPRETEGRWRWAIRYGTQPLRDYELRVLDAEKGRYEIDERNSITLPAWQTGGELISLFSLSGQLLTTRYRVEGDRLHFEVLVTKTAPTAVTGGEGQVPAVGVHLPLTVQRGTLGRRRD
jgi:hypothetical protein